MNSQLVSGFTVIDIGRKDGEGKFPVKEQGWLRKSSPQYGTGNSTRMRQLSCAVGSVCYQWRVGLGRCRGAVCRWIRKYHETLYDREQTAFWHEPFRIAVEVPSADRLLRRSLSGRLQGHRPDRRGIGAIHADRDPHGRPQPIS